LGTREKNNEEEIRIPESHSIESKLPREEDSIRSCATTKSVTSGVGKHLTGIPSDLPANATVTVFEPISNTFYLNLVLLNKNDVVEKIVKDKVGSGVSGLHIRSKLAATVAKKALKDEAVSSKLAEKLVDLVPKQIADLGIKILLEKRFIEGPLLVLQATIKETDGVKMMTKVKGEEAGKKFAELQEAMAFLELEEAEQKLRNTLLKKARNSLMEKLCTMLPNKLYDAAGARVEVTALSEAEQPEWFYNFLQEHRKAS